MSWSSPAPWLCEIDDPKVVTIVHNPRWQQGQAGSLQLAHRRGTRFTTASLVVVGLADQPFIPASAWRAVATAASAAPIVVATYDGVRGPNPVRLHPIGVAAPAHRGRRRGPARDAPSPGMGR